MKLTLKVVPGSSRDQVVGRLGDAIKVRVSAPPEKGKANRAVAALLAAFFELDPAAVQIVAGAASSRKIVELEGADPALVAARLASL
ncbi:MAG TPA: DUF167 domain-containing protein [Halieaceae bacterium]|nr:DUF167 domain-containing protein [Halieaceae bacterium]